MVVGDSETNSEDCNRIARYDVDADFRALFENPVVSVTVVIDTLIDRIKL